MNEKKTKKQASSTMWPLLEQDPQLLPAKAAIDLRMERYQQAKKRLLKQGQSLSDFANGSLYYGFHLCEQGWYYREWAPAAEAVFLCGDFNHWDRSSCPLEKKENGNWELFLPGADALQDGQRVLTVVQYQGEKKDRIPLYANYVCQEADSGQWNAVIHRSDKPFAWTDSAFEPKKNLYIYECHIGMAQEQGGVGTYREFKDKVLPRIQKLGYNTIQIMAVMEHPYYASFGYQVSNFFAASSRYGTGEELKELINAAHSMGIAVLLDVVHAHMAPNTREGICEFDGSAEQFCPPGEQGQHPAWGTRCFDYEKPEVLHFLLSNLKFWLEEYHFDGFRFDGVTSMLYYDHGLGRQFGSLDSYFSSNSNLAAVTYLQLATELVKEVKPNAILIAEEMSALPGLCRPIAEGGLGFDYRLAMGEPDLWIRLLKEQKDEDWDLGQIWSELSSRRPKEKVIAYVESHDQALVGDKTLMFRLCDREMYTAMKKSSRNLVIERGMALHKLLRLLTMTLGGEGYLTFMGNEFGHPEWIDFPREGNQWSYQFCRRQWSLVDNPDLRYEQLNAFDMAMIAMAKKNRLFSGKTRLLHIDHAHKVLSYQRGSNLFLFNLHPSQSYEKEWIPVKERGAYMVQLSSDDERFGGQGRIAADVCYYAQRQPDGSCGFSIYLPSRTAVVLKRQKSEKE